jgi:hypothetical protein
MAMANMASPPVVVSSPLKWQGPAKTLALRTSTQFATQALSVSGAPWQQGENFQTQIPATVAVARTEAITIGKLKLCILNS